MTESHLISETQSKRLSAMKRADAKCDHIEWSIRLDKNLHRSMVVNLEDTLWQRQNRLLMGWIYSTLTESIMSQIIGITTAQSVWNSLERMSTAINRARLMELRFMLQTTKKGGMKMMDYILTIQGIIDNLAAIGENF